ncbi:VUT family protein [Legionella jamestowniensis]|uniref:VUT family protein n=1 Tax=Legionella jamestowniensis TaxID=455 RepID=UPI000A7E58C5|nr:VUT family protein [Legionella jamestowniensis]
MAEDLRTRVRFPPPPPYNLLIYHYNFHFLSYHGTQRYKILEAVFAVQFRPAIPSKTMASKFISIGFVTINAGGIVFSLAYLASDIMTDVYGIERTKQITFFVIFANLLFMFDIWISNLLAVNEQSDFGAIFHNQARIFLASGIAFFLGMIFNSTVISMIKARQTHRGISLKKEFITIVWMRVATSSSFGIILDVILFSLVAFYGIVPNERLASIVVKMYTRFLMRFYWHQSLLC